MHPCLRTFLALLPHRPSKALQIAWWWITRRRVRALGQLRAAAAALPDIYQLWLHFNERPDNEAMPSALVNGIRVCPSLAVHLHLTLGAEASARSVLRQLPNDWRLYVTLGDSDMAGDTLLTLADHRVVVLPDTFVSRAAAIVGVLKIAREAFLIPLRSDCLMTPGALAAFAQAAISGDPAVLYADQDELSAVGKREKPWLKPSWDEDLFFAQDYLSAACALPVAMSRKVDVTASISEDTPDALAVYALLARLLTGPAALAVRHVPYVAVSTPSQAWQAEVAGRAALVREIVGLPVSVEAFGTLAIHRALPDPSPKVSVIVPTRDRLDLLETCVEGVLYCTDFPDIELIVADNDSIEPQTLAYFEKISRDPRVKVVRWPHPYNYSAVNNFAVAHAAGSYICLLNNDTEVIDPAWLREMVTQAARPGIGAVGARLFYPDRSIQHAGVVVGMGNAAGHAHRGLPEGHPGWFAQALVTREATAVTAACLVVAKDKFEAVGGLDEARLAIAYNDIDFCLKLRAAGWRNIYAADAVMIHHESKSRGLDFAPEHLARYMRELEVFQERWNTPGFADPTHHPALDPASEIYRLRL